MNALHADARQVLQDWAPPSPDQARLRDRYVAHLRAEPTAMTRACFPDHLTAGTLVLAADGESVLLNLHRKAQRWFAFGGHCEPADQTLAAVALREAVEESGIADLTLDPTPIDLDEHAVEFCDPRGTVRHLDVRFAALADPTSTHGASEESLAVRWWPLAALPELEDEMLLLIQRARERLL